MKITRLPSLLLAVLICTGMGLIFLVVRIIQLFIPPLYRQIARAKHRRMGLADTDFDVGNWADTFPSWTTYRSLCRLYLTESLHQSVNQGGAAMDFVMHSLEGKKTSLLSYAQTGRPLVFYFGSCS